jgi:cell division protein FtsB
MRGAPITAMGAPRAIPGKPSASLNAASTSTPQGGVMVVRTRLRAILTPLLLYVVSGAMSAYFVQTAIHGERGLKTKDEYKIQIADLRADLDRLKAERAKWQHRVTLMHSDTVDSDLAGEQIRLKLGYVDAHDLVIFTDANRKR